MKARQTGRNTAFIVVTRHNPYEIRLIRRRSRQACPSRSAVKQICLICGETYTVVSGSQKCCKACAKKQTNAKKQQPTAEYIKEKYDYIRFNVPKGEGDKIKAYAQEHGMTVKNLMLAALEEYKSNHGN